MVNSIRIFDTWTPAENDLVNKGIEKHGRVWVKIQLEFLPWRTPRQIELHFRDVLDPSINRSEWSKEEIRIFKELCISHPRKWTLISKSLPGRSPQDLRHKNRELESSKHLTENDEDLPKAKKRTKKHYWIKSEDDLLLNLVKKHGLENWNVIKKEAFHDLSKKQLRERYKKLTSEHNIKIKKESKKRIDRPEPEPKRRRLTSQPPQTPTEVKVQELISDFLMYFERLTNSTSEFNHG